ncbi:uncharacterized protein [Channa argus]|uniref:uncharacterized protein n=1 Tax=Channa argus TaxID=215402 RepID=UPI0029482999|nr:hypothetical protein Q8A73_020708 [Channa argus]
MKRRFKEKHRDSSSDRGVDISRRLEELRSSALLLEKDISEERESDGQAEDPQDKILGEKVQKSLPPISIYGHDIQPALPTCTQVTEPGQTQKKSFNPQTVLQRRQILHDKRRISDRIKRIHHALRVSASSHTIAAACQVKETTDLKKRKKPKKKKPKLIKYVRRHTCPGTSGPTGAGSQVDASNSNQSRSPSFFITTTHGFLKPVVAEADSSDQIRTKLFSEWSSSFITSVNDSSLPENSNKDILNEATGGFEQRHHLQPTLSSVFSSSYNILPAAPFPPTDFQYPIMLHDEPFCSPSITSVDAPSPPQSSEGDILKEDTGGFSPVQSETEPEVQLQGETEPLVTTKHFPVTNTQTSSSQSLFLKTDSSETRETSRPLPRSHSVSSLRPATCAETKILTRSQSLPELKLRSSFEDFTPDISVDEDDETYRFQFSCPGLYQCTVTGLVFDMEGEGDVVYRTVPWNRRLLSQHHKKPAGPLFDIKCVQQSVCQLHVPHCEILSTGGFQFLSVAHVTDEGIEFIRPQKITETHVVINITGFSGYGTVKDEDSPPDPVRALVLLFYRPPDDPDPKSFLNVLLVPRNIVLKELLRTRRDERHIETSPHCKLQPNQFYTLSTRPQNRPVKIEPPEAEFDDEFHSSYFTTFQVILKTTIKDIKLVLKQKSSSNTVWKREVYLPSTTERNSCAQFALKPPPNQRLRNIQSPMSTGNRKSSEEKLLDVRSRFVDGISEPVLKCLLDKLLEKKVMNDSERESMNEKQNKRDKARFVIDTVRKKGEAASSEMIECLCGLDTFFCDHLGLK